MGETVVVGVTGASGSIYARRLLLALEATAAVDRIELVISTSGRKALREELDLSSDGPVDLKQLIGTEAEKTVVHSFDAIESRIASGSNRSLGMVVVPCSVGTLARIANGISESLLTRAADVALKEGRRLILCIRETPLSAVHIENMGRANAAGATIMPAMPAFYSRPASIDDMVDHFLARVLDHLGLEHELGKRWQPGS